MRFSKYTYTYSCALLLAACSQSSEPTMMGLGEVTGPEGTDPSSPSAGPSGPGAPASVAPGPGSDEPILGGEDEDPFEDVTTGITVGSKVDLLFVVDNSTSMGDKQALFLSAVPDLIGMLVDPPCVDNEGVIVAQVNGSCPLNSSRIFPPVTDIHLGVISSSLGAHGLGPDQDPDNPTCPDEPHQNDRAQLIPFQRPDDPELVTESYNSLGFLVWDPNQVASPPGEANRDELVRKFQAQVASVKEQGCGFEAPLEAAYRFLIDPAPYDTLVRVACYDGDPDMSCVSPQGVDNNVLAQRAAFLRPDSHLVVTYLTDENDCSIRDSGQGYYTLRPLTPLARGSAQCLTDPNDPCCQSCGANIREGCPTDTAINGCGEPKLATLEATAPQLIEAYNVRCFDQKRRFGIDLLYSTNRYLAGFLNDMIFANDGSEVPNPLYALGRSKSRVFVVGIVGTPWQDVTVNPPDAAGTVQRAADLPWERFLPAEGQAYPTDPFNIEAMGIRQGVHPLTGDTLGGPETTNSINGHDRDILSGDGLTDDLQYACTFELTEPRDCAAEGVTANNCDCTQTANPAEPSLIEDYATGNPLCLGPEGNYGTTQYRAKAYPGSRVMEVVRGMQGQGVLGSICPKNPTDPSLQDYGYRPPIRALMLGLSSESK